MSATTSTSTPPAPADLVGATIRCPRRGCARQAKIKRDRTISSHTIYGRHACPRVGKPAPADVTVIRPAGKRSTAGDVAPVLFDLDVFAAAVDAAVEELAPPLAAESPEQKLLEKVARKAPHVGMPAEHQILAARTALGLSIEVYDGPANELWRVEGCPEKLTGEVAWWLFGGRYGSWEGRERPMFRASLIGEAIAAGRYNPPGPPVGEPGRVEQAHPDPGNSVDYDQLLLDGKLVDSAGRTLTAVDCFTCETRRPHKKTSGITCPYEVHCPTCKAKVNSPCTRPSGHVLSEGFGALHEPRKKLAQNVDDARAAAGDLTVPAPWPRPANDDVTLAKLRADIDKPGNSRVGRENAREAAERYAAGLPLVRFKRKLNEQWVFVCPVPTCGLMYDGHDTIREARAHWFEHAATHEGFTTTWPDDVLPVEPEPEQKHTKRLTKAKSKRKGPPSARIEIVEPVGNDWWDDSALAWEKCGLLTREGGVALLSIPQGYAKAVEFAELLAGVGGVPRDSMIVHTLTEEKIAIQDRRDPNVEATPASKYDRNSLWCRLSNEAHDILATATAETPADTVAWAVGVTHFSHAAGLQHFLASRNPADLRSQLVGGTLGGGRQYSSDSRGCKVIESTDYTAGYEAITKVTWARVAKLIDPQPAVLDQLERAVAARGEYLRSGASGAGREEAEDACCEAAAAMWDACRPAGLCREKHEARMPSTAAASVERLPQIPPRPAGQVPVIVEVFDPPSDEWWTATIAEWKRDCVTYDGWVWPDPENQPVGVPSFKVGTPWDEEEARVYADLVCKLGGLSADRVRVFRAAAAPEPSAEPAPKRTRRRPAKAAAPAVVVDEPFLFDLDAFAAAVDAEI